MLAPLLALALLASPAHAGDPCSALIDFEAPADTGLARDMAWGSEADKAQALLADQRRPDCAKLAASDINAALRDALAEGWVDEDEAGEVMARLGRVSHFSSELSHAWRLLQQGRPDQAQRAGQDASSLLHTGGLAAELGPTRANRMESLLDDLFTLAQDAADVRAQLSAGDTTRAQQDAEVLWRLAEGWCHQGRLGQPQCEAITTETATLMALVQERGQGSVPYLYQQDNLLEPDGSGGNTAVAMLLRHFGAEVSPDEITRAWGHRYADKAGGLATIFNDYAVKGGLPVRLIPHSDGSMAQLDRQLDAGTPTIVHGQFASSGHAVVVLRREGSSYVVNDPGGRWTESWRGGYGYSRATDGQNARYGGSSFRKAVATHDGVNSAPVQWQEIRWLD
jgi:hypothetical protein